MNLNNFRQDGFDITSFSIVDYKNFKVVKQIGDSFQTNVPYSNITPIPVLYSFLLFFLFVCVLFNKLFLLLFLHYSTNMQ